MLKKILLLNSLFIIFLNAQAQTEYQTNYYELVKEVRDIVKKGFQPLKTSKTAFSSEIFEIAKTAHRLQEEAMFEALESDNSKLLDDIAFGCKICDVLLDAIELKVKSGSKKYDTYVEKLKSLELAITLKIKAQ